MAANIILGDKTTDLFRAKQHAILKIVEGLETLLSVEQMEIQARDGDGSDAAHYDQNASLQSISAGDYADANTAAKASFDEGASLIAKLNTDASVSNVRAAIYQYAAKHGVIQ